MLKRSHGRSILFSLLLFASLLVLTSCGASAAEMGETLYKDYIAAIEAGDGETAASYLAEDVEILLASGNLINGINEARSSFIQYDLDNLDSVTYLTDFTERDGWIVWSERYELKNGGSWEFECKLKFEDGKITKFRVSN
jgi:hypothetical protein